MGNDTSRSVVNGATFIPRNREPLCRRWIRLPTALGVNRARPYMRFPIEHAQPSSTHSQHCDPRRALHWSVDLDAPSILNIQSRIHARGVTMEPILQMKNLRTYFHTDIGVVKAVDDLTVEVKPGQTLGIVGDLVLESSPA